MADELILGHKIVGIRNITKREEEHSFGESWGSYCPVLILDNGVKLFPSRDEEGNGTGALFGERPDGSTIWVPVPEEPVTIERS